MEYKVQFTEYQKVEVGDEPKLVAHAAVYKVDRQNPADHKGHRQSAVLNLDASLEEKIAALESAKQRVLENAPKLEDNEQQIELPGMYDNAEEAAKVDIKEFKV